MSNDPEQESRPWQEWFLNLGIARDWQICLEITGLADQIKADMAAHKAIAVSDGSFQTESRAAAWIIEGSMAAH